MAELAHRLRRIAHLDLPGAGQVVVDRGFAYIGHMKPPHGTSIVDVRDPRHPRVLHAIMLADQRSHTHKVRVVGDLMVVNVEPNERHAIRRAARAREVIKAFREGHGRDPTRAELAAALNLQEADLPRLVARAAEPYREGGFRIDDIGDRSRPQLLAHVRTARVGAHRFDLDSHYAYISTKREGFLDNILVIDDLADPTRPQAVSRWWLPGQHVGAGERPRWDGLSHRLHHGLRHGDALYAAVWDGGCRIIDISDIHNPRALAYHPPFPEPTHTFMRVPFAVQGRSLAVAADEAREHIPGQPHAGLWVFDVGTPGRIHPIGLWHISERATPFFGHGHSGCHQFQEHMSDTRLYAAWFSGGLRVVDIADPFLPREVAWSIPEPCGGQKAPPTNDVDVDADGLIHIVDRHCGYDILEPLF
jgi:hypothetical protein